MTPEQLANLTPEQKRIKIAEACRWIGKYAFIREKDGWIWKKEAPDYLNDLNAMHGAEKTMTRDHCVAFSHSLALIVSQNAPADECPANAFWFHSRASQRADAFLLSIPTSPCSNQPTLPVESAR